MTDIEERFWSKVDADGDCWQWMGATNPRGYGNFAVGGSTVLGAHRVAWQLLVGEIRDGHQLDHLCRNTGCVNPDHLEMVTPRLNALRSYSPAAVNARRTSCVNGHPFDESNTYVKPSGKRQCRECGRTWMRAYTQRKRKEVAA